MSTDPNNTTPQSSADLGSATILTAMDVAFLAYDTYTGLGNLMTVINGHPVVDPVENMLTAAGWTPIVGVDGQTVPEHSYQGDAFYKTVNGTTEVIIGNRGSQSFRDFAVSDAQIAAGITPDADPDALKYYRNVISWLRDPANNVNAGTINVIETGHSLGGQEADFVDVEATPNPGPSVTVEAVSFDAPGIARGLTQPGLTYNALNISLLDDFVHVGGAILGAGFVGNSVTVKTGIPLAPFLVLDVVGMVAADGAGVALETLGSGGFLYSGLYQNHVSAPMRSFMASHPALAGVNLLDYQPTAVTQDAVNQLIKVSPSTYLNDKPEQLKALYDGLLHSSGTQQNNASGGEETFTVTTTDTGISLEGSQGDEIILTTGSNTVEIDDSAGDKDVLTFSADGTALQSDTWTSPDGTKGTDTYNADGSSSGTVTYASGGYATIMDDGQGNVTTDYFTKNGILYSDGWVHSDGTSGTETMVQNGLTRIPDSASSFDVPSSEYTRLRNPDGTYSTTTWESQDQYVTTGYAANGSVISTSSGQGQGRNFDTSNLNIVTSSDGSSQSAYDADNHLVWTQVTSSDGSYTKVSYNASSDTFKKVFHAADQTADTYWRFGGNLTHDTYNSSGQLTGDDWSLADGSTGSDTVNANGSLSGTINHADGTISIVGLSASQQLTIVNRNSSGVMISQDWWNPDNSHGITLYNADGSSKAYTYQPNGLLQETDYAPDGGIVSQRNSLEGLSASPDGSQLGMIANSDGTKSIDYTDSNGDTSIFVVTGSGQIQGTQHVDTEIHSSFAVTLPDGTPSTSPYNSYTVVYTTPDGTKYVDYINSTRKTGDDWTAQDSSHGYDVFNSDGSQTGVSYSADGSYYAYTDDGQNDKTTTYYAANGGEIGDAWEFADGSHGGDQYNSDGSSIGAAYAANGTYTAFGTDSSGNSTQGNYSASGTLLADTWAHVDGSHGGDIFNADGSTSGSVYQPDGNYRTYTANASGDDLIQYYTPTSQLAQTDWKLVGAAGANITYTFDGAGDLLARTDIDSSGVSLTDTIAGGLPDALGSMVVAEQNGIARTTGSSGGVILARGNQDSLTSGGGTSVLDAAGSNDVVTGGSGNDTLAALGPGTSLVGGLGHETFEIHDASDVIQAQSGAASNILFSSVSYTLPVNVDLMTLTGSKNLVAVGNSDATNVIIGNDGNDILIAGSGSDTLISGSGVDQLYGYGGTVTFVINNSNDQVIVSGYQGQDTIQSSVDYDLTAQVGTLALTGTADLTATDDAGFATLIANSGSDTLIGGSGSDLLVAGSGVDTFITGTGFNTLVINNTADVIEVSPGAGSITVDSSVSYALASGIDTLVLTDNAAVVGQGNDDPFNSITGNSGSDTLIAGSGNDTLVAGSGDDTLIAGSGNDTLQGGSGHDTYVFNAGFGDDRVQLAASNSYQYDATIQFGAGISESDLNVTVINEYGQLELQISDGNSVLTLNDGGPEQGGQFAFPSDSLEFSFADGSRLNFGQLLAAASVQDAAPTGGGGDLVLNSTAGASLVGGNGDDTLIGSGANDTIEAGRGNQIIYGSGNRDFLAAGTGDDTIYAGGTDDTLAAGSGSTELHGGAGNNTYILQQGGSATLFPSSGHPGAEIIYLPTGMALSDFTALTTPGGDLILQSNSGDTTAIVKGYASGDSGVWLIADQNGHGMFLQDWLAGLPSGPGNGTGGPGQPSAYEQKMAGLLADYQASLGVTLRQIGSSGGSLLAPYLPGGTSNGTHYTFTGLNVQNLTVQGGSLSVGGSDFRQFQTVDTGEQTETVTYRVPVYQTITVPSYTFFVPTGNAALNQLSDVYVDLSGDVPLTFNDTEVTGPPQTSTIQVGTRTVTETIPVHTSYTTETQGLTVYNIKGDGGSDVISAAPMFAGTVVTGDGNNVSVDLGLEGAPGYGYYGNTYSYPEVIPPGAFIEVGNGVNDTIVGTGNADVIAAGLGFDSIFAGLGSTVYVPMEGASTDIVEIDQWPVYGTGPFPKNTLVLPDGITPQDLQYRVLITGYGGDPTSPWQWQEEIQLTYGDSTVLIPFDHNPFPTNEPTTNYTNDDTAGINRFQFSDGTVLTRDQVLALAGAPVVDTSGAGPVITQLAQSVVAATSTSGSQLFAGDGSDSVRFYQVSNDAASGAFFTLNGVAYPPGQLFDVAADQLSQLQYFASTPGSVDTLTVKAFDGLNFGDPSTFTLSAVSSSPPDSLYQATAANQTVYGGTSGPDTLVGGFGGDTLVGASGQDTFQYNPGSGPETLVETQPGNANVLQLGNGINPNDISLSIVGDPELVLSIGSGGDSLTMDGFNPTDPLKSMPIQQFHFADGTNLSFTQLLSQVGTSSGSITNADGSVTSYSFTPGQDEIYSATTSDAGSDAGQSFVLNADGSSEGDTYDAQGRTTLRNLTNADGSTTHTTAVYNADGSRVDTEIDTPVGGGGVTTTVTDIDASGNIAVQDVTNPDGSTDNSAFTYNSDGTLARTETLTPAGGGSAETILTDFDAQGRWVLRDVAYADGSTDDSSIVYHSDGSLTRTESETPPDGGAATTFVMNFSSQGQLTSQNETDPDGTLRDSTYGYNADGSYVETSLVTPPGAGSVTTQVSDYDSGGNRVSDNSYTPGASGSYLDTWEKSDGSNGNYWWNSSTSEYEAAWYNSDGSYSTDDYQYAAGGSPGASGVSFTETYRDTNGGEGTRQYDAATGVTTLSWYSAATGTLTGTTTDTGFIGLQNDGELTNTQHDPSFFNPAVSPSFQSFLAGH